MLKGKSKITPSPANTPVPGGDKPDETQDKHHASSLRKNIVSELKTLLQSFIEYAKKAEL